MLAGVAGGLAEQLGADPSIIRILWVLVAILSGGIAVIVYIAMAIIVPEEDDADRWSPGTATEAGTTASAVAAGATDPSPPASAGAPPVDGTGWVAPAPRPRRPRRQGDGGRRGAIVFGLILVLIGAYLLIREFAPAVDLGLVWPIASIVLGVVLVILSIRPKQASS